MPYKRAYKYRVYPTEEQTRLLARTFGCCRYVYNWALQERTIAYREHGERLSSKDLSAKLTDLKKQEALSWLGEVSSVPLQQSLRHLDTAFKNFFEGRADYPVFKKKHGDQTATYTSNAFTWDGQHLTLAKTDNPLPIVWSRPLPEGCKPSSITISKDTAGRYFISLLVEEEIEPLPPIEQQVGVDVGLKVMIALSTGETVANPKFFAKSKKKLAKAQRQLSKKNKGSKNRAKARRRVARLHTKVADQRRNFQHQLSTKLIKENQVVCIETLSVKNMLQNHCLASSISDVGWGEFVRQLEYKAQWYGRTLIKIDRWYPSSKTCSACEHVLDTLSLDIREWTCPRCGVCHDRDINAAHNILAAGLAVSACGGGVRPNLNGTREGNHLRSRNPRS